MRRGRRRTPGLPWYPGDRRAWVDFRTGLNHVAAVDASIHPPVARACHRISIVGLRPPVQATRTPFSSGWLKRRSSCNAAMGPDSIDRGGEPGEPDRGHVHPLPGVAARPGEPGPRQAAPAAVAPPAAPPPAPSPPARGSAPTPTPPPSGSSPANPPHPCATRQPKGSATRAGTAPAPAPPAQSAPPTSTAVRHRAAPL